MRVILVCLATGAALSLGCSDAPNQPMGSSRAESTAAEAPAAEVSAREGIDPVSKDSRKARALASRTADQTVPQGSWAGAQVNLVVTSSGGTIELSCGHGTIDQTMLLNSSGGFDASGTYVQEGGPTTVGPENRLPARYSGLTDGKSMTLTITLSTKGQKIGPLQLQFGRQSRLVKCL